MFIHMNSYTGYSLVLNNVKLEVRIVRVIFSISVGLLWWTSQSTLCSKNRHQTHGRLAVTAKS